MEMSHRSKDFVTIVDDTEKEFRKLLAIPEEFEVFFGRIMYSSNILVGTSLGIESISVSTNKSSNEVLFTCSIIIAKGLLFVILNLFLC